MALGSVALLGLSNGHCTRPAAPGRSSTPPSASTAAPAVTHNPPDLTGWKALPSASTPAATTIFWEAEKPKETSYGSANPFAPADADQAKQLSSGAWIGAKAPGTKHYLVYDVTIATPGTYEFFVRKFWKHGPFRYRFDDQPWTVVPKDALLIDDVPLRVHVSASWVAAGAVTLSAGTRTLRIELTGDDPNGASAWDAFVLTMSQQTPRGLTRPDSRATPPPPGYFTFEPGHPGDDARLMDLRNLNEKEAGSFGFVTVDGDGFARQKNPERLRFWGVNATAGALSLPRPSQRRYARELAARGVNLVRIHTALFRKDDIRLLDRTKVQSLHELVNELKAAGIYSALSLYFPVWYDPSPKDFAGYDGKSHALSLLYFNRDFEAIYRGWWKQLLASKDPDTGELLATDPAVAMAELLNEDSTLFWSFKPYKALPEAQTLLAEAQFGRFLAARYGSVQKALSAWGGSPVRGDDAVRGRAGFVGLWDIVSTTSRRTRDTAEFLATSMRDFYARTYAYLKGELGFRAPIVCSNWITADSTRLGPLDKWANTSCDVMDRHGYYGGPHSGTNADHKILSGHTYADASALRFDPTTTDPKDERHDLPIMNVAYAGKPSIVSEINWPRPNRFRAELVPLAMAYGSLQGTSAYLFFTHDAPGFASSLTKFSVADPVVFGQFPAAALAFRRGDVARGKTVAKAAHSLSDLFALKGGLAQPESLDQLRRGEVPAGSKNASTLDPFSFLVGRVEVSFTEGATFTSLTDLSGFVNRERRRIVSTTGELRWSWDRGLFSVSAGKVEGAAGFFAQSGPVSLGVLELRTDLEYGSVLLVSTDGLPVLESKALLLQFATEAENDGFTSSAGSLRTIGNAGGPPLVVKRLSGTVGLKRKDAGSLKITALDPSGRATHEWQRATNEFPLLPSALYYRITVPEI